MLQIIKLGSACLFDAYGGIAFDTLRTKAQEIEETLDDVVLVVSGAIALGKMHEGEARKNADLTAVELQGYACLGQPKLMQLYADLFTQQVSQLLLTSHDLLHHENHISGLVYHNIGRRRITVVNYNDGVDFEQLRKDNDTLAATILRCCGADRLVILGHYDGMLGEDGKVIPYVNRVSDDLYTMCRGVSTHGNGGFATKLDAARQVLAEGKEMIIGNIKYTLRDIVTGTVPRTYFKLD
ncbi:hypothetical protein HYY69_01820 [Candidatus Woesearchaeota archaeon]|nr:hypothetical protein [Candidatus Woesearchaeota archaeon]